MVATDMSVMHRSLLEQIGRLRQYRDELMRKGAEMSPSEASLVLLANVEMEGAIEAGFTGDEARMALALKSITGFNCE